MTPLSDSPTGTTSPTGATGTTPPTGSGASTAGSASGVNSGPTADPTAGSASGAGSEEHTRIDDRIRRVYAVEGALSVPGVVRHSSGLNRITGRRLPRAEVRWDAGHRSVSVDVQVAVAWPSPVVDVATTVRETVGTWVTAATGTTVSTVNVEVSAVVPAEPGSPEVTADELASSPRAPELTAVEATPLAVRGPEVTRTVEEPAHPAAPGHGALVPVTAARPPVPEHVDAPARWPLTEVETHGHGPLTPVTLPAPVALTPVVPPAPRTALVPDDPVRRPVVTPPDPVRSPTTVPAVPAPPVPEDILVDHHAVTTPVAPGSPRARGVLRDVPTPRGPQLENIPTPQGLPVRAVPTPDGLPVTRFPSVARRGVEPVTVNRHPRIPVTVERSTGTGGTAPADNSNETPDDERRDR